MSEAMDTPTCINCGATREQHHADGWCFWLSDTDHLPIQFSTTERAVLMLVDEHGKPLRREQPKAVRLAGRCVGCDVEDVLYPTTGACACLVCAGCAWDFMDEGACGACGAEYPRQADGPSTL